MFNKSKSRGGEVDPRLAGNKYRTPSAPLGVRVNVHAHAHAHGSENRPRGNACAWCMGEGGESSRTRARTHTSCWWCARGGQEKMCSWRICVCFLCVCVWGLYYCVSIPSQPKKRKKKKLNFGISLPKVSGLCNFPTMLKDGCGKMYKDRIFLSIYVLYIDICFIFIYI